MATAARVASEPTAEQDNNNGASNVNKTGKPAAH